MVISDLAHLSDITSVSDLLSGGRRGRAVLSQSNKAIVYQSARASATAFAYHGNASATSVAINNSDIGQSNSQD